ncbi:cytochrome c biogenesis protein CcmG, thiol:disulfide interchange protein DsbE [Albimonas pacifica]|uniref:Cytochrome c biogenesis protein CcmG, thiol:disulfide interchange protein DsbE n=2 Tax=Albimonas pacifica TaxID=1114924 RepID=A0A1I3PXU5_9RHOB|nr:DsbE family thiol:disulfide interchange protein [Albimonas pacifica]SFJ26142.1 cytochrome c biogenesis protein CcmG, thiol:disulfide interchange protein DsbE [Albimonas pacifica]
MARPVGGRLLAMIPIVIAALLGVAFYWGLWNKDDRLPSTLIGRPAPVFALPPIEGRNDGLSSEDLRGEVSIVNVWASWCVPCRVEMPLLVELAGTGTVPIHGINYKDAPDAAVGFLSELGDPYTRIGADRNGRVSIDWGVYGLPETFVIDRKGRIAYKHVGPFDRRALEEEILPVVRRLQAEDGS